MSFRRIAVTGGAGYIGSQLIKKLCLDNNIEIICIDRHPGITQERVKSICLDLATTPVDNLADILDGVEVIFHLAAARVDWGCSYEEYRRDNVLVTENLIDAANRAGITNWIYYGTVGVYGSSGTSLNEDSDFNPNSDYGKTKAEAENKLLKAAEFNGWTLRIIRPSAVFSENQPHNTNMFRLIEAIRNNRFVLIGSGSEIKTTSYLPNLLDATFWLFENISSGIEIYNYVDEPKMRTVDMVKLIRAELNKYLPLIRLPLRLVETPALMLDKVGNILRIDFPITSARIRKFCTSTDFDASLIREKGYKPKYGSQEAIKRTVKWHKENL